MPKKSDFLPLKEFFYFPKEISLYRSKQKQISKRKLFLIITTKKANNFAKKTCTCLKKAIFLYLHKKGKVLHSRCALNTVLLFLC